jgi:hypothetical protein
VYRRLAVIPLVVLPLMSGALVGGAPAAVTSAGRIWHLHESDSGSTLHVERGDIVKVRLPGGTSGGYHRPRTSDRDVLRRRWAEGGYPSDSDARAAFLARHNGTADLTSYDDYACLHTEPRCLPPQREWIVHVVVRSG